MARDAYISMYMCIYIYRYTGIPGVLRDPPFLRSLHLILRAGLWKGCDFCRAEGEHFKIGFRVQGFGLNRL